MRRVALTVTLVQLACGARTGLDAPLADAGAPDAADAANGSHDAAVDRDAAAPCDFGTIVSDVFGATVSWNGGAPLPAGHYRITYVDGCMKYGASYGWTVNAYASGPDTLWVVGNGARIAPAPGTVGFLLGQGGFATFDACVAANLQDAPYELDWPGGTLGLELADDPYSDNVAGENGRSPTYALSSCAAPASCDWTTPFDSVTAISELDVLPGAAELRLSQDELVGYFYRSGDIYVTHRPSLAAPFAPPVLASDVSSPAFDADPFLSADGLSLYVNSQRPGTMGESDIFVGTRATTSSSFSAPVPVANVNSPAYDGTPYVTNDGHELWLASSRAGSIHLFRAMAQSGGFGSATPVGELNAAGAEDNNPVLTSDGLTLYFSSNRFGSTQVLVAHRTMPGAPFSPPSVVSEISTSGSDYPSWISPDSCRLYMTRGTSAGFQLYVATRH